MASTSVIRKQNGFDAVVAEVTGEDSGLWFSSCGRSWIGGGGLVVVFQVGGAISARLGGEESDCTDHPHMGGTMRPAMAETQRHGIKPTSHKHNLNLNVDLI